MKINSKINSNDSFENQNEVKKDKQEISAGSQKVMQFFLKTAAAFALWSAVLLTGVVASTVVPGAQSAGPLLFIASAVLLAVSSVFLIGAGIAKAVASSKISSSARIPTYEELMDYKNLPAEINLQEEIARAQLVKNTYIGLQEKHPGVELMTKNYGLQTSDGRLGLWMSFNMRGLSLVASEMKAKHGLEHLYVCESLEAFQSKLLEISQINGNLKASLVVPTSALSENALHAPESQHKSTVCIEKKDGKLKIMYIDSQPMNVDESLVKKDISELQYLNTKTGNHCFMVFWAIYHSGLDMSQTELSRFIDTREHAHFGCETFALKDSVAFLRTENMFEKVIERPEQIGGAIREVIALPPDFMKTAQSMAQIEKYAKDYPAFANQNLIRREGSSPRTLREAVKLRTKKGYNRSRQLVDQNHYTSTFSVKYHKLLLDSMANLETKAIQEKIDSTFVSVERPLLKRGETPKTIYDLFNKWRGNFEVSV